MCGVGTGVAGIGYIDRPGVVLRTVGGWVRRGTIVGRELGALRVERAGDADS